MASNIPSLSSGTVLSASSHWNVMKADVDALWDGWPQRALCFHQTSTVTSGTGPLIAQYRAAFNTHDGAAWYLTTPADGDIFTNSVCLEPGTYTMYVYGLTSPLSAKIDWTLGGSSIATAQDWYSGGVASATKTITSIVVSDPGRYVVQGTVNGRNGSASGWRIPLTRFWFKQSSDT